MTYKYCCALRPGCYASHRMQPIISRHRTFEAAQRKARANNRLGVYRLDSNGWITGDDLITCGTAAGWIGDGRTQDARSNAKPHEASR